MLDIMSCHSLRRVAWMCGARAVETNLCVHDDARISQGVCLAVLALSRSCSLSLCVSVCVSVCVSLYLVCQILARVARLLELAESDLQHFKTVTRAPEGRPRAVYPSTALQVCNGSTV